MPQNNAWQQQRTIFNPTPFTQEEENTFSDEYHSSLLKKNPLSQERDNNIPK